jgi:hypothetical protein
VGEGADDHLVALVEMSDMMKHRDPVPAVGRIGNSLAEVEKSHEQGPPGKPRGRSRD